MGLQVRLQQEEPLVHGLQVAQELSNGAGLGYYRNLQHSVLSASGSGKALLNQNHIISAVKRSIGSTTGFHNHGEGPTRAFSWLKAPTSAFTFKTLLRHYAKRGLTPRSLNVKLGPRRKGHKGRAVWLA